MKLRIKLDEILNSRGMSRRELARQTGIRHATINDLCNNTAKHLSIENLEKICSVLGIDITDLLEGTQEEGAE